jgi:hypothetical protein
MKYNQDLINKIYNYKTISNREKINRLLEIDANQYCNLGVESTKQQKEQVKKNSRYIYKTISKINPEMGRKFLYHQD